MVAGDGDGITHSATSLHIADGFLCTLTDAGGAMLAVFLLNDHLLALMVRSEGVEDAVSGLLEAVTEGVVMTFVVVVTHA